MLQQLAQWQKSLPKENTKGTKEIREDDWECMCLSAQTLRIQLVWKLQHLLAAAVTNCVSVEKVQWFYWSRRSQAQACEIGWKRTNCRKKPFKRRWFCAMQVGVPRHHYWSTWLCNLQISKRDHELIFLLPYSSEPSLCNRHSSLSVVFPRPWGAFHFTRLQKNLCGHQVKPPWSRWAFCPNTESLISSQ